MKSLQVMNAGFENLGELAQFESIQMTRSYWGTGSISITTDPRAKNVLSIVKDTIVFFGDDPENANLIEDISEHSRTKYKVKGCMLKGLAKRRVCVPPVEAGARPYQDFGWDRFTGSAEAAYRHFANNNLIFPDDAARAIPNLVLGENLDRGAVLPWQARFDKLSTLFETIGETTETGWDIRVDLAAKQFIFQAWQGIDRTSGDALCLISEENGNAANVKYKAVYSGSSTTAYVGGAGEDEDRFILSEGGSVAGLARRELWAEAGSLEDPEMIALYAQNKLTDAGAKITLTADLIDSGACRYGRDYAVGDKVLVSGRGVYAGMRVTEISETYEKGCRTLKGTFGSETITVGSLLNLRQTAAR